MSFLFPDIRGQVYSRTPLNTTLRSSFLTAADQRKRMTLTPTYFFNLGWEVLTQAEAGQILSAVESLGGAWGNCYFFEWDSHPYTAVALGTGNNTGSQVFTLPAKTTSLVTIYRNGTPESVTFSAGTGTYGEDQVTVTSPGTATYTAGFTGRYRRLVTLSSDGVQMSPHDPASQRWGMALTLRENR